MVALTNTITIYIIVTMAIITSNVCFSPRAAKGRTVQPVQDGTYAEEEQ